VRIDGKRRIHQVPGAGFFWAKVIEAHHAPQDDMKRRLRAEMGNPTS
jgi:hypothetical protein